MSSISILSASAFLKRKGLLQTLLSKSNGESFYSFI